MKVLRNQHGSVLISALIIIAVLLTLFLSAFSFGIARYSVYVKKQHLTQAQYLAESGINRFVANLNSQNTNLILENENSVQFTFGEIGECLLSTRPFGAYLLLRSIGTSGSQKSTRYSLLGTVQKKFTDRAISIFNNRYPLVVTGTTRITGDIFSGPIQLTTGQIEGRGAVYRDFLQGRRIIEDSVSSPYQRFAAIDDYIRFVYKTLKPKALPVSTSLQLKSSDMFLSDKNILAIQGNLDLRDIEIDRKYLPLTVIVSGWVEIGGATRIEGLVEIISEKYIHITDSATIIDGLIMAEDSIVINKNAYISSQIISRQEITVEDFAVSTFPTLILVSSTAFNSRLDYGIRISSHAPIEANILYVSADTLQQRENEIIIIDSSMSLSGCVFSSDFLSLQGDIAGSVMTGNFKFTIPPTTYVNWLKDIHINVLARGYTPVMPLFESDSVYYSTIPVRSTYE